MAIAGAASTEGVVRVHSSLVPCAAVEGCGRESCGRARSSLGTKHVRGSGSGLEVRCAGFIQLAGLGGVLGQVPRLPPPFPAPVVAADAVCCWLDRPQSLDAAAGWALAGRGATAEPRLDGQPCNLIWLQSSNSVLSSLLRTYSRARASHLCPFAASQPSHSQRHRLIARHCIMHLPSVVCTRRPARSASRAAPAWPCRARRPAARAPPPASPSAAPGTAAAAAPAASCSRAPAAGGKGMHVSRSGTGGLLETCACMLSMMRGGEGGALQCSCQRFWYGQE